jgi:hypothetical protein
MMSMSDLRWHWGEAYVITGTAGHCRAERRDDGRVLTAGDPETLRLAIIADYTAKPVPRAPLATAGVEDHAGLRVIT